jgi:protein involved in polysaccharide export with SLBB domain
VRVNGQGEITLPLVGVVQVKGLSPQKIEKRLVELYGANYLRNCLLLLVISIISHT